MAWNLLPMQASESKTQDTLQGVPLLANGPFYLQYGAASAIANTTTETSLLAGSPTTWSGSVPGSSNGPSSTLTIPAGAFSPGTTIQGYLLGIIQTTGTPTIRIRPGIVNAALSFTALADYAATALTAAGAGSYFRVFFTIFVSSTTAMLTEVGCIQGTTAAASALTMRGAAPQSVTSLDLTVPYSLDVRLTWGAASASNTVTIQSGWISLVG